jgi:hypothetical protein
MPQSIIKTRIVVGLLMILTFVIGVFAYSSYTLYGQEESTRAFRDHLQELRDNNRSAYIGLVAPSPLDDSPGWAVPEDFTNEAGGIIGRRIIGEIGEDFVCIDNIGQGYTITFCIPFTSIAYIMQPAI